VQQLPLKCEAEQSCGNTVNHLPLRGGFEWLYPAANPGRLWFGQWSVTEGWRVTEECRVISRGGFDQAMQLPVTFLPCSLNRSSFTGCSHLAPRHHAVENQTVERTSLNALLTVPA
jgi:hypothetical protein